MDEKSLSHTSWNCKYHIVLVPKYRRKSIYGKLRKDIGKILRMLCDYKHVEIIEAHAMPDHIHMLLSIPPKLAVADFMGYLKGKSTLMIFERHANLKYKYGKKGVLDKRILRKYRRWKRSQNPQIHSRSGSRRSNVRSVELQGIRRSVQECS